MKGPRTLLGKSVKCVRCGVQVPVSQSNTKTLEEPDERRPPEPPRNGPAAAPPRESADPVRRLVGEKLIEEGMLTRLQLDEALALQAREGGRILNILLSLGYLSKTTLHEFLSRQPGIASIDLKSYFIPKDLISLVPKEIAQECLVLPIDKLGRLLTVGMACPLDVETITQIEKLTGLTVKPMLCKMDDILATIERYYPLERPAEQEVQPAASKPTPVPSPTAKAPDAHEASVQNKAAKLPASVSPVVPLPAEIKDRFARLEALPTFADTVGRMRKIMDGEPGVLRGLAEIVAGDPPVAVKLLSIANAAAYGMPGHVMDLNLASTLLGSDGVCEIAMLSVIAGNQYDGSPLDYDAYAHKARFTAMAARGLADASRPAMRYAAQVAGLLHSIGSLALAAAFPKRAAELDDSPSPEERIEQELTYFGMGYPEAGALYAKEWGIPKAIVQSIRLHRDIGAATAAGPLEALVALGALLTDCYGRQARNATAELEKAKPALDLLKLSVEQGNAVYEESAAFLNVRG